MQLLQYMCAKVILKSFPSSMNCFLLGFRQQTVTVLGRYPQSNSLQHWAKA